MIDTLEASSTRILADPLSVFYRLTAAFNAHDVEAMLEHVDEDVQWFSVQGDALEAEARGKEAFREAMMRYFEAIPDARSEVESAVVSGAFVSVRERAFWGTDQSQVALGVFEVREGRIRRAWYYPASR